jgi:hypothetical protein
MELNIIYEVERFLTEQGIPPTKLGRIVAHDPRLVLDMRNGRQVRPKMQRKLLDYMSTCQRTSESLAA